MAAGQSVGAVHEVRGVDQHGSAHADNGRPPQRGLEHAAYRDPESRPQGELEYQTGPHGQGEQVLGETDQCEGEHRCQPDESDVEPCHDGSGAEPVQRHEPGHPSGQ